jgi:hypothetical protein
MFEIQEDPKKNRHLTDRGPVIVRTWTREDYDRQTLYTVYTHFAS